MHLVIYAVSCFSLIMAFKFVTGAKKQKGEDASEIKIDQRVRVHYGNRLVRGERFSLFEKRYNARENKNVVKTISSENWLTASLKCRERRSSSCNNYPRNNLHSTHKLLTTRKLTQKRKFEV
jgi:hypothetical protein